MNLPNLGSINLKEKKCGNSIRIMHISDLHFNKIDENKKRAFESDLRKYKPNIIVITGDLIQSPWFDKNLEKAKEFVDLLGKNSDRVIIAPGNHEKLFRVSNKKFKNKFNSRAFYCEYIQFSNNRDTTFFVFDSTYFSPFFYQRGKISKNQINSFKECVGRLRTQYAQDFERSFKIAVLHHHPLPTKKNHFDKLLYLKNAGEFIESLMQGNINMVLHGHQHDPVDYSFQWDLRYIDPQPHMVIISAGTLLKQEKEKNKLGLCEKTNYYVLDIFKDKIEGQQMYYNYMLNEFVRVKDFMEKIHLPKFYKYNVDLTWEIIHPNYDNKVTRKLNFRAWAGEKIDKITASIASTVKADTKDLKLNVHRKGYGDIQCEVTETIVEGNDYKEITIPLDPHLHYGDDEITISCLFR